MKRDNTRRERYSKKALTAQHMPVSVATVNFFHEVNVAYVIRAGACFGAANVYVIGRLPERKLLGELSGTMNDYVNIKTFPDPHAFIEYCKTNNIQLICAELPENGESAALTDYNFDFSKELCIVVGNESIGIPVELSVNAEIVHIPMHGIGYCLNTAQAANVMLYEARRQYERLYKEVY